MVDRDERKIRRLLAGAGAGCFVLLLALEIATESDELTPLDIAADAPGILLPIGAAVGVALLAQRMQTQHEEHTALLRELEVARAAGKGWCDKVRDPLPARVHHAPRLRVRSGLDEPVHRLNTPLLRPHEALIGGPYIPIAW